MFLRFSEPKGHVCRERGDLLIHKELVKNSRFIVYISLHKLSFSKISGLETGMEKEIYAEGGDPFSPHVFRNPMSQLYTMRLERGLQSDKRVIRNMKPGVYIPFMSIFVMDDRGRPVYEYFTTGAYVTKWETGALDAETGNVLVETFEIEHSGIIKTSLRV